MVNELRVKVLERVKDEFKKQYNSFAILQRIEEKKGVLFFVLVIVVFCSILLLASHDMNPSYILRFN
jgi:hypothetical protein